MRLLLLLLVFAQIPGGFKGCSEAVAPDEPEGLTVSQRSGTSVQLGWSQVSDVTSYKVTWETADTIGPPVNSAMSVQGTMLEIDSLESGRTYDFHVSAVKRGKASAPMTASWTLPGVYTKDLMTGEELRLYWRVSPPGKGAGLVIDPRFGGPRMASIAFSSPDLARLTLIADIDTQEDQFSIGPPAGFTEFPSIGQVRRDVFCVDSLFHINTLASWQDSTSLEIYDFDRMEPFRDISAQSADGKGLGLLVRFGPASGYYYARVFIKPDPTGSFIRVDQDGDRYIVLEVAFQSMRGVPYV